MTATALLGHSSLLRSLIGRSMTSHVDQYNIVERVVSDSRSVINVVQVSIARGTEGLYLGRIALSTSPTMLWIARGVTVELI